MPWIWKIFFRIFRTYATMAIYLQAGHGNEVARVREAIDETVARISDIFFWSDLGETAD